MAAKREDLIAASMRQKNTDELLAIWTANDRREWSDTAFEAISQVLIERGLPVPEQRAEVSMKPSRQSCPKCSNEDFRRPVSWGEFGFTIAGVFLGIPLLQRFEHT